MNILIAYYSKTGNTERVAKDLAARLGADLEKIIDKKNRFGFWNWFMAGRDAMKKSLTEIDAPSKNPQDYDLVIIGSPVWGWTMVPAVRTYIDKFKTDFKDLGVFVTSGDTAVEKMVGYFEQVADKKITTCVGFSNNELKDKKIYENKLKTFCDLLS